MRIKNVVIKLSETLIVNISEKLKEDLRETCDERGVKMSEVVRRGVMEQISQLKEVGE